MHIFSGNASGTAPVFQGCGAEASLQGRWRALRFLRDPLFARPPRWVPPSHDPSPDQRLLSTPKKGCHHPSQKKHTLPCSDIELVLLIVLPPRRSRSHRARAGGWKGKVEVGGGRWEVGGGRGEGDASARTLVAMRNA